MNEPCIYCGSTAGDEYHCPDCGAEDLTEPRESIRESDEILNDDCTTEVW